MSQNLIDSRGAYPVTVAGPKRRNPLRVVHCEGFAQLLFYLSIISVQTERLSLAEFLRYKCLSSVIVPYFPQSGNSCDFP